MTSTTTIILMLYFIGGSLGHVLPQSSIVGIAGGHSVNSSFWPYMAALLDVNSYKNKTVLSCGGTIIHKQFVLTAASCIEHRRESNSFAVRVGSSQYDEGGRLHEIEKYIIHESYSGSNTVNNDVGLIKLSEPVTFGPSVAMIKLADDTVDIPTGLYPNVTEWGESNGIFDGPPRYLEQLSVLVMPLDVCSKYYYWMKFTDKQICVNNIGNTACYRDIGGPLIAGDLQIGIASHGISCWDEPFVYEKVASHLQWIRNKIKQNL